MMILTYINLAILFAAGVVNDQDWSLFQCPQTYCESAFHEIVEEYIFDFVNSASMLSEEFGGNFDFTSQSPQTYPFSDGGTFLTSVQPSKGFLSKKHLQKNQTNSALNKEPNAVVKAFPGAQGYGANTPGGRGGTVLVVTKLQDDGSKGTLRWAVKQSGPRIVVFGIGGVIELEKRLSINKPFITIAGQTAPGAGITLAGGQTLSIRTHDVIIRGIRSRPGDGDGSLGSERDALSLSGARNVIIDHCSFTWATDENVTIWNESNNITFSSNLVADALDKSIHEKGPHSKGMIIGNNSNHVSVLRNVFANNVDRNPLVKDAYSVELVNNYVYGWGDGGVKFGGNSTRKTRNKASLSVINNYFHHGSETVNRPAIGIKGASPVYLSGNVDTRFRRDTSYDEYNVAHSDDNLPLTSDSIHYTDSPGFDTSELEILNIADVKGMVLNNAGTSSNQHEIDLNIIEGIRKGTGRSIDSQREVGGYGKNLIGSAPIDSDDDGMPDTFEVKFGYDPLVNDATDDIDGDGFTNIENFINCFYIDASASQSVPSYQC